MSSMNKRKVFIDSKKKKNHSALLLLLYFFYITFYMLRQIKATFII